MTDRLTKISTLAAKQWESRTLNLDTLRALLPETSFRLFAGDDNPFVNTLEMSGIGFSKLYASLNTSSANGINGPAGGFRHITGRRYFQR